MFFNNCKAISKRSGDTASVNLVYLVIANNVKDALQVCLCARINAAGLLLSIVLNWIYASIKFSTTALWATVPDYHFDRWNWLQLNEIDKVLTVNGKY